MRDWPIWRSMLFVPAHREDFVAKAHTRNADAYVLDLEDSVPHLKKNDARGMIQKGAIGVSRAGAAALVRVNQPWVVTERDLEASISRDVRAIVMPKVNDQEYVRAVDRKVGELELQRRLPPGQTLLLAQIEDVAALPKLDEIAASSPRLMGMTLGSEDFSTSAGMEPIVEALLAPNQEVLFACRRAGIVPLGFPGSIADYADLDALRRTLRLARKLGFVGAFCIHPCQVSVLNEEFTPSQAEVEHALAVVAAYEASVEMGQGATEYQGRMIDLPVVSRAQELLRRRRC